MSQGALSRAIVLNGIIRISARAIGQLKSRWRCLDRSGGLLLYHPEKVCRIVQACGVLHNIAHSHGVPLHERDGSRDGHSRDAAAGFQVNGGGGATMTH
ncbi:putative nuclease HARBI1 [Merluccius polli]|uniref:Nuclease HARBI1 n=1 Tax=Merluccius polli TaxID=89951 RepID=A0AA47MFX9_MERPO|nr:putative nuclease HARBI1 [Merluccius polli]